MSFLSRMSTQELLYFGEAFLCTEEEQQYTVQYNNDIGFKEFEQGVQKIFDQRRKYKWGKVYFHFRQPVDLYHRGKSKSYQVYPCTLFVSLQNRLCYKPLGNKRTGWYLDELPWEQVEKIVLKHPAHEEETLTKNETFQKSWKRAYKARFDEQTWTDLKPDQLNNKTTPIFFDMKKVWFDFDLNEIEQNFKEKKEFTMDYHSTRRHYKVIARMENGIYRAWFTNRNPKKRGDFKEYILLNPNLAVLTYEA